MRTRYFFLFLVLTLTIARNTAAITCEEIVAASSVTINTVVKQTTEPTPPDRVGMVDIDRTAVLSRLSGLLSLRGVEVAPETARDVKPRLVRFRDLGPQSDSELAEYEVALLSDMLAKVAERGDGPNPPNFAAVYATASQIQMFLGQFRNDLGNASAAKGALPAITAGLFFWPVAAAYAVAHAYRVFLKTHLDILEWVGDVQSVVRSDRQLTGTQFLSVEVPLPNTSLQLYFRASGPRGRGPDAQGHELFVVQSGLK